MATDYDATVVISDYKALIRELNKIEPELVKQLRADLKQIAEIPRKAVRAAIPSRPPLSGMKRKLSPVGKTWNTRVNARTVTIKTKSPKRGPGGGEAVRDGGIIQLVISSPATIIADMAGRGNMKASIDGQKTDWYVYPLAQGTTENTRPGMRRHTVNGQGYAMVRALGDEPSRYAYPAVEDVMPETADRLNQTLADAAQVIERNANG